MKMVLAEETLNGMTGVAIGSHNKYPPQQQLLAFWLLLYPFDPS